MERMPRMVILVMFLLTWAAECSAESVDVKYRGAVTLDRFSCSSIERSSFIRRVCYDGPDAYMIVKLNDTYYHYCDIDKATVDSFLGADSMGRFYNASIKGRFDCRTDHVPSLQ